MEEKQTKGEVRNKRLRKVAGDLFLRHGYEGVTIDKIVGVAGGSKSTVYGEFGGKCGLFISSIEELCRQSNEPLAKIDYTGLDLKESLMKLAFEILKLITTKRSIDLHRLAIGEAANCPEVGEAWYVHGPARTTSFITAVLERHRAELRNPQVPLERIAVALHDALVGDTLYRRLAGVTKSETEEQMRCTAEDAVFIALAALDAPPGAC